MHELAITESLVECVCERVQDTRVRRLVLEIGTLSTVVPDALRFCFDVCAAGTVLEGAALDIVEIRGRGRCRACDDTVDLPDMIALCACGSADVEIVAGRELRIKELEVI